MMANSFQHKDDFEYILPDWGSKPIEKFVQFFFKNFELQFALIEITTIKNRTGIGDILIWTADLEAAKVKASEYQNIIKQIQKETNLNLAEYKCWYEHFNHSYIFLAKNEIKEETLASYNRYKYEWREIPSENDKHPDIKNDNRLSKNEVIDFLNNYADKMHAFELHKYPHYSIIIKPISFPREKKNLPPYEVGTFYVHIGTSKEVSFDKYYEFINNLFLVWMKDYAVTLIEEFKKIELPSNSYDECLPPWKEHPRRRNMYSKIKDDIISIYTNYKSNLEDDITSLMTEFVYFLISDDHPIKDELFSKFKSNGIDDLYKNKGTLSKADFEDGFKKVLIQREVFKVLLVGGINPANIHGYLKENDIGNENYSDKVNYFWTNRFIPTICDKTKRNHRSHINVDDTIKEIKTSLSVWEKQLLTKYLIIIESSINVNNSKAENLKVNLKNLLS